VRSPLLIAMLITACAAGARAQEPAYAPPGSAVLHGHVVSAGGERIAGARLRVLLDGRVVAAARSDAAGRFRVESLQPGAYVLQLEAVGHDAHTQRVALAAGEALRLELRMATAVLELAPLTVIGAPTATLAGVPGSSFVVGALDMQRRRPAAAHEMLRQAPGVHVQEEDPLGVNLNIGVRGLNPRRSARVLLLEDGVPILLGPYGDPSAHYQPPANALRRIEVVKGSGQIAHGPQTVGGVINFVRVAPPERSAAVLLLGAGDRAGRSGFLNAGARFGAHAAALTLDGRETDGARRGWNHRVGDVQAQLLLALDANSSLLVRGGRYAERSRFGETGLTQAEFDADPFGNPTPHDTFDLERYAAHAVFMRALARGGSLTTVAYAQDIDRTSWRQASSSRDRFGDERYAQRFGCAPDALGIADCGFQGRPRRYRFVGIEPRLRAPIGAGIALDAGARVHVESAHRRQYLAPARGTAGGEASRDNVLLTTALAAFAQTDIARRAWRVTPGVRIEHVRARNENRMRGVASEDEYTRWIPGIGVAWNGLEATTLFAGAHRGFAPPRPADVLDPEPGQSIVQVEPELSWNYEIGARSAAIRPLLLEATLFRIDFTNQIIEGGAAGSNQRFINAGTTLHQGAEIAARLDVHGRRVMPVARVAATLLPWAEFTSSELSSRDGTTPIRGNRLPYAPRTLLSATAGFTTARGFELVHAERVAEQFSDDLNTRPPAADGQAGALPAYAVVDLGISQRMEQRRATLFMRVGNVLDRVYITERQEGIIVGMPRRVAAGVEVGFGG
jgi:Fe(3+) dicitrate transport protein